jgi:hypothetical protein
MQWCVRKLLSLPSRNNDVEDAAFMTEAFIDACGDYPDDLWTLGTTELLKTKTFRPSPAEFLAVVGDKFRERQRMLERVKQMLTGAPETPKPDAPFVPPPLVDRVRTMRDAWRKIGRDDRAQKHEVELAGLEGREIEDWAHAGAAQRAAERLPDPPLPETSPGMRARTLLAVARTHRTEGRADYAAVLEQRARELVPVEQRDIPEADHGH